MRLIREEQIIPTPSNPPTIKLSDSDDEWILASALDGGADLLFTGDQDLLILEKVGAMEIICPREFVNRFKG